MKTDKPWFKHVSRAALAGLALAFLLVQAGTALAPLVEDKVSVRFILIGSMVAGFVIGFVGTMFQQRRETREVAEVQERRELIKAIEQRSEHAISNSAFVEDQIKLNIERERLNMLLAERRANNLFSIGRFLMVLSVLAPLLSAALYLWANPLPAETVSHLKDLREAASNSLPVQLTVSVQRDWRILFAGVSIGFLFLAAARGVLTQQARQSQTFFFLAERVASYERLISVIRIRTRQTSGKKDDLPRDIREIVIGRLLTTNPTQLSDVSTEQETETSTLPPQVSEIVKHLRDFAAGDGQGKSKKHE